MTNSVQRLWVWIWKNLLPECKDGIYYLIMQKTESAWEYKHQKGDFIYTRDRGLEKIEKNIQ